MTLPDVLGRVLTEIRSDPGVSALTTKIRGGQPAPDDARGSSEYQRFVVLVHLGTRREKRVAFQEVRIAARCYGTTFQDATLLAHAVSDAIHGKGARVSPTGVGIFNSFDDQQEGTDADPDTGQPNQTVMILVNAAALPIS